MKEKQSRASRLTVNWCYPARVLNGSRKARRSLKSTKQNREEESRMRRRKERRGNEGKKLREKIKGR